MFKDELKNKVLCILLVLIGISIAIWAFVKTLPILFLGSMCLALCAVLQPYSRRRLRELLEKEKQEQIKNRR